MGEVSRINTVLDILRFIQRHKIVFSHKMKIFSFLRIVVVFSIVAPRWYAKYLLVEVDLMAASRFRSEEDVKPIKVLFEDMINGANSLFHALSEASDTIIDPSMKLIQDKLDAIESEFMHDAGRRKIVDAVLDLTRVKSAIRRLKDHMNVLAETTISQVDLVTNAMDSLTSDKPDELIELNFKKMVRHYLRLLDNSKEQLDDAKTFYLDASKNLLDLETRLVHYKADVESYMNNEDNQLDDRIHDLRAGVYGTAAICVIVIVLCPAVYTAAVLGVELTIDAAKDDLEKQKGHASSAIEVVNLSRDQVENAQRFINAEYPLILKWKVKVENAKDEAMDVKSVLTFVQYGDTEGLKMTMNSLKEVCKKYLEVKFDPTSEPTTDNYRLL